MLLRFQLPLFRTKQRTIPARPSEEFLIQVWRQVRQEYFPDRLDLDQYSVEWSKRRQKRTLASCNVRQRRIVVARELNRPDYMVHWSALLYHEMCHAALGESVERTGRRRLWHGPSFKKLEMRHPGIAELHGWIRSGGWLRAVLRERVSSRFRR